MTKALQQQITFLAMVFLAGMMAGCAPHTNTQEIRSAPGIWALSSGAAAAQAAAGDVLYLRDGALRAVSPTGENDRELVPAAGLRSYSLSPDGQYAAYVTAGRALNLLNLATGEVQTVTDNQSATLSHLVWSPDAELLYFQRALYAPNGQPNGVQVWEMPPGLESRPVLIFEVGAGRQETVFPMAALGQNQLIVLLGDENSGELFVFDALSGDLRPFGEGFRVWDVSPSGEQVLLYSQADVRDGWPQGPVPLYLADFDPQTGLANVQQITPQGEQAAYIHARFNAEGSLIAALRHTDAGTSAAVLQRLNASDGFALTETETLAGQADVSFAWGPDVLYIGRAPAGGGTGQIVTLLLGGTQEQPLVQGDMPQFVNVVNSPEG